MKLFKKLLCLCAAAAVCNITAVAESPPEAGRYAGTGIVNLTGQITTEYASETITYILRDKDTSEVLNIGETGVGFDGSYRTKFKYTGDISGCELSVKQGDEDITDTVVSAVAEEDAIVYSIDITNSSTASKLNVNIENWYNIEGKTYSAVLAYYDANQALLGMRSTPTADIVFDDKNSNTIYEDIPEGTEAVKVFIWNSLTQAVPLCAATEAEYKKDLSVLAIGNSFVDDPLAYLKAIAAADGVTLNVTGATHGGASLEGHWNAWVNDKAYYASNKKTIDEYLDNNVYDIITIQQVSHLSGDKDTYLPYAENMVKYLREKQPFAEIVLQETWAYEKGKTSDPEEMHNNTKAAVEYYCEYLANVKTDGGQSISLDGEPLRYIPSGDAMWNARQNPMFDTTWSGSDSEVPVETVTLWRDGYHCSYPYGRYLTGLVWYGCLAGNSVLENQYVHPTHSISDTARALIKQAAAKAIEENGKW